MWYASGSRFGLQLHFYSKRNFVKALFGSLLIIMWTQQIASMQTQRVRRAVVRTPITQAYEAARILKAETKEDIVIRVLKSFADAELIFPNSLSESCRNDLLHAYVHSCFKLTAHYRKSSDYEKARAYCEKGLSIGQTYFPQEKQRGLSDAAITSLLEFYLEETNFVTAEKRKLIASLTGCDESEDIFAGREYEKRGDIEKASIIFKKISQQGSCSILRAVAYMHLAELHKRHTKKDGFKAMNRALRKAAELNYKCAFEQLHELWKSADQKNIALIAYSFFKINVAQKTPTSLAQAAEWLKTVIETADNSCYGHELKQKAFLGLRQLVALNPSTDALVLIGELFENGRSLPQDSLKALVLYYVAALNENSRGIEKLKMHANGNTTAGRVALAAACDERVALFPSDSASSWALKQIYAITEKNMVADSLASLVKLFTASYDNSSQGGSLVESIEDFLLVQEKPNLGLRILKLVDYRKKMMQPLIENELILFQTLVNCLTSSNSTESEKAWRDFLTQPVSTLNLSMKKEVENEQLINLEKNIESITESIFRLAESKDHADLQLELSEMYREGTGLPQDAQEAQNWHDRAEKNDPGLCQQALGQKEILKKIAAQSAAALQIITKADLVCLFNLGELRKNPQYQEFVSPSRFLDWMYSSHLSRRRIFFDDYHGEMRFIVQGVHEPGLKKERQYKVICTLSVYMLKRLLDYYTVETLFKTDPIQASMLTTDIATWIKFRERDLHKWVDDPEKLIQEFEARPLVIFNLANGKRFRIPMHCARNIPVLRKACENKPDQTWEYQFDYETDEFTLFVLSESIHMLAHSTHHNYDATKDDNNASELIVYLSQFIELLCEQNPQSSLAINELLDAAFALDLAPLAHAIIRYLQIEADEDIQLQFAMSLSPIAFKILSRNSNNCGFLLKCFIQKLERAPHSLSPVEIREIVEYFAKVLPQVIARNAPSDAYLPVFESNQPYYIIGESIISLLRDPVCQKYFNSVLQSLFQQQFIFRSPLNHRVVSDVSRFEAGRHQSIHNLAYMDSQYLLLNSFYWNGSDRESEHYVVHVRDGSPLLKGRDDANVYDKNHVFAYNNSNVRSLYELATRSVNELSVSSELKVIASLGNDRLISLSEKCLMVTNGRGHCLKVMDSVAHEDTQRVNVTVKDGFIMQRIYPKKYDELETIKIWRASDLGVVYCDACKVDRSFKEWLFYKDTLIVVKDRRIYIHSQNGSERCITVHAEEEISAATILVCDGKPFIALAGDAKIYLCDLEREKQCKTLVCRKSMIVGLKQIGDALQVVYDDSTIDEFVIGELFKESEPLDFFDMLKQFRLDKTSSFGDTDRYDERGYYTGQAAPDLPEEGFDELENVNEHEDPEFD